MNRFCRIMTVAAVWTVCAGCSGLPTQVQVAGSFSAPQTPYGQSLVTHTRAVELYNRLDTVAKAWATWESRAFRTVFAEETIRAYRIVDSEAQTLLDEARGGPISFHISIYTPKSGHRDLEDEDSLWRAYMVDPQGEHRVPASHVEEVEDSERAQVMYPYITPWTRQYKITFDRTPKQEAGAPPVLELAGPLGTLVFDFRPE